MISIIIPSYNRAHLIVDTLNSIVNQTYTNWECVVVDDGSTDDTLFVLEKFALQDHRIKFYKRPSHKPKGANACRNYGFEKSTGEYVIFFDSDDIMLPEKLELQLNLIQSGNYDFSVTQTELFNTKTNQSLGLRAPKLTSENLIEDFINFKAFWLLQAVLYKKSFLIINQLYLDETLQQAQDYDFHLRVLQTNYKYKSNEKVTTKMLVHGENMSNSYLDTPNKIFSNAKVSFEILNKFSNQIQKDTYSKKYNLLIQLYRVAVREKQKSNVILIFKYLFLLTFKTNKIYRINKFKYIIAYVKALVFPFIGFGFKYTKLNVEL